MDMAEINRISNNNLKKAKEIIEELRIKEICEKRKFTCNLVGSVKTKLLSSHLDIDFHIYSDNFSMENNFNIIAEICKNSKVKEVNYKNLLDKDDMCLEWHLNYEDNESKVWVIDIMYIKNESIYAGMIEKVTDNINRVMTEEMKDRILRIKYESWEKGEKIAGIKIYEAVIDNGVKSYQEFKEWENEKSFDEISLWEPKIIK